MTFDLHENQSAHITQCGIRTYQLLTSIKNILRLVLIGVHKHTKYDNCPSKSLRLKRFHICTLVNPNDL